MFAALIFINSFAHVTTLDRLNTKHFPENQNIELFSLRNAKIRKCKNGLTSLFFKESDKFTHQINRLDKLFKMGLVPAFYLKK